LDRNTRAVIDESGRIRAYAIVYEDAPGRTEGDVLIDPKLPTDVQDRLLDDLIDWYMVAALDVTERKGLTSTVAVLAASQSEGRMFEAYARHGFTYARTFWRMTLRLADAHPAPFEVDGLTIGSVDPNVDDVLKRLHLLDEGSFFDHYGFVAAGYEAFATNIRGLAGFDREATWIAVDEETGADAGFLIGTDRRAEDDFGFIAMLGVMPAFRGRGLAKALLATAFDHYRARGMVGVQLGVDAQNTTGATQLYRSVGMSESESFDVWELALTLVDDSSEAT
jgi:ribosomal protein S18 acetylase RimI-like enzyme